VFVCSLVVSGHSAGGHLAACMLYTEWRRYGVETQPLCGAVLMSGVYDLDPIHKTTVNNPLNLTEWVTGKGFVTVLHQGKEKNIY